MQVLIEYIISKCLFDAGLAGADNASKQRSALGCDFIRQR
jgi:hypothetical protein